MQLAVHRTVETNHYHHRESMIPIFLSATLLCIVAYLTFIIKTDIRGLHLSDQTLDVLISAINGIGKVSSPWIGMDKIFHFFGFFTLALILYPFLYRLRLLQEGIASLLLLAFGSELMQIFVPHRMASVADGLANTLGMFVAAIIVFPPGLRRAYWGHYGHCMMVYWLPQQSCSVCESQVACPVCEHHSWRRVPRVFWMRLCPASTHMVCNYCESHFLFSRHLFLRLGVAIRSCD